MPTEFSPRITFQTLHKASAEELKAHREDAWLKTSLAFAVGELAFRGATAEQLYGARQLIHTLQNLWEGETKQAQMPRQSLGTYDRPIEEVLAEQKEKK
jgi:hypothetical protein